MPRLNICFYSRLIPLFLSLSTANFGLAYAQEPVPAHRCAELLTAAVRLGVPATLDASPSVEDRYQRRLAAALDLLGPDLFNRFAGQLTSERLREMRALALEPELDPKASRVFVSYPGFKQFILDLAELDFDTSGALFGSAKMPAVAVRELLAERGYDPADREAILDREAVRIRKGINGTLAAVVKRALGEYAGTPYQRGLGQRVLDRVHRFIFPLHNRVTRILNHGRNQNDRLEMISVADEILASKGTRRAQVLELTAGEQSRLRPFLNDSPDQVKAVHQEVVRVYGALVANGVGIKEDKVDLKTLYRRARTLDLTSAYAEARAEVIQALDVLDEVLDQAFRRRGASGRPMSDRSQDELNLRFDETTERADALKAAYLAITDDTSNEWYTVEDQHTRQVEVGKDKDGNPIYQTEVYYVNRTVYPTYENILADSFDRGDRFVSGLDSVRYATAAVRREEGRYRSTIRLFEQVADALNSDFSTSGVQQRAETMEQMARLQGQLQEDLHRLRLYLAWPAGQIRVQWGKDDPDHFKRRNKAMLLRLENAARALEFSLEILKREMPSARFLVKRDNFTEAMNLLRKKMWVNYAIKFTAVSTGAGGGYYVHENPQAPDQAWNWLQLQLQWAMQALAPYLN